MQASLAALAELVHGRLVGDGGALVSRASPLSDAQPGDITILDDDKAARLESCRASAAVVPAGLECPGHHLIQVADPHAAFAVIHRHLHPPRVYARQGISPAAHISATARLARAVEVQAGATLGDDVEIGEGSTIHSGVRIMAGCKIGRQVILFPNVVLYENTIVGDRVIIHAGAVVGAYGFGYRLVDGKHQLSAQLGNVIIESDVEIGACSTIDRGTYGATRIGQGTKLDNQVMIGHNCRIGRHNLLCSHVGIAGSTTTGDYVVMAGQVGVSDHLHVGQGAQLGAQAGVYKDIPAGEKWIGTPAAPARKAWEAFALLYRLPEMRRQLRDLQRTIDDWQRRPGIENRSAA